MNDYTKACSNPTTYISSLFEQKKQKKNNIYISSLLSTQTRNRPLLITNACFIHLLCLEWSKWWIYLGKIYALPKNMVHETSQLRNYQDYHCNDQKWSRPKNREEDSVGVKVVLSWEALPVFPQEPVETLREVYPTHCNCFGHTSSLSITCTEKNYSN